MAALRRGHLNTHNQGGKTPWKAAAQGRYCLPPGCCCCCCCMFCIKFLKAFMKDSGSICAGDDAPPLLAAAGCCCGCCCCCWRMGEGRLCGSLPLVPMQVKIRSSPKSNCAKGARAGRGGEHVVLESPRQPSAAHVRQRWAGWEVGGLHPSMHKRFAPEWRYSSTRYQSCCCSHYQSSRRSVHMQP